MNALRTFAELDRKRVLIVGAGSGIGAATAELVAELGGTPILAGRNRSSLELVAQRIGHNCQIVVVDVTNSANVVEMYKAVGSIDHVVITAAELYYESFIDFDLEHARKVFDVKFWGAVYVVRYGFSLLKNDSSIVLLGGLASDRPGNNTSMISAVNGAVTSLGKALAVELSPIRVNVVSPGVTATGSWNFMNEVERGKFFESVAQSNPAKKVGEPVDIASAIVFAMTNTYLTGEIIAVNGGGSLI